MRPPTDLEREQLAHRYDPVKAHEYYERTKKLKGRNKGQTVVPSGNRQGNPQDPRTGKTRKQISKDARAQQRKELKATIDSMQDRLKKLEALIKKREREEASEDRKGKAKKERTAKENEKPKSAAEKAKAARENEKYRDKHKQELKNKAKKDGKSGGGSKKGSKDEKSSKKSVSELKSRATKLKGEIAVAKQKLAAL
jgi:hypothetical protein